MPPATGRVNTPPCQASKSTSQQPCQPAEVEEVEEEADVTRAGEEIGEEVVTEGFVAGEGEGEEEA